MDINTYSAFLYGYTVTSQNYFLPFKEGVDDRLAQLNIGSYTFTRFVLEVSRAMNKAGVNEYTMSVDRNTQKITISSDGLFDLEVDSVYSERDCFELMGFVVNDKFGLNEYTSDVRTGNVFYPQYKLQGYIDFEDEREASSSAKNITGSGKVEVVKFGDIYLMTCNIVYSTDIPMGKNGAIKNNQNGVSNLRQFLAHITNPYRVEFIPDIADFDSYTECLLDSSANSSKGTGYKMQSMKEGKAYKKSGELTFRRN